MISLTIDNPMRLFWLVFIAVLVGRMLSDILSWLIIGRGVERSIKEQEEGLSEYKEALSEYKETLKWRKLLNERRRAFRRELLDEQRRAFETMNKEKGK